MSYTPAVLLGCAIGDALGMPFEMRGCTVHPKLVEWSGGFMPGTFHPRAAGEWTDDTEMSIELARSLLENGGWNGFMTAQRYIDWINGEPTGAGSATRNALKKLEGYHHIQNSDAWKSFGTKFDHPEEVGSGTAMRASPIGAFYWKELNMLRKVCREDAYITHQDKEGYAASLAVAATVAWFIQRNSDPAVGCYKQETTRRNLELFLDNQMFVVKDTLVYQGIVKAFECQKQGYDSWMFTDEVAGRFGNAWQIVSTSLFCLLESWGDFATPVQKAISLGGDADTRGAIVGAMAGAKFGLDGIPAHLISGVLHSEMLQSLDTNLYIESQKR